MISYANPKIELNPEPAEIDASIQKVQEKLSGLAWLDKIFGRAVRQSMALDKKETTPGGPRVAFYPEVYNEREPLNIMPNDNLKSYCFFYPKDPLKFNAYESFVNSTPATQPLSLICWVNLKKIDSSKNYNFAESLLKEMIAKLKFCPDFKIDQVFTEYDKVFNPFTLTEIYRQYMKPPFAGWRIDGEISFDYSTC